MSDAKDLQGTVTQFNRQVGLGEITDTHAHVWPFHCVSLADGTRTIEVGTSVVFDVQFHVVREEAFNIRTVD